VSACSPGSTSHLTALAQDVPAQQCARAGAIPVEPVEHDLDQEEHEMLRTIGVLAIIAAVVLAIGFTTGWFTFGSQSLAGETQLTLRIDREEVREDIEDVRMRVSNDEAGTTPSNAVPPAELAAGTLTGDVLSVEPASSKLKLRLLTGDERTLIVAAESATELTRVKPGDRVELTTVVDQGRTRIVELRVL
jgi:hypothetical protein